MAKTGEATTIEVRESGGKLSAFATTRPNKGLKRGLAIFDFVLRICTLVTSVAAAASMATTQQDLPFFSQFLQFSAGYDDFTTFSFFVIANAIVCGYLVLSLPFSFIAIIRHVDGIRLLLQIIDMVMLTFTTAAASAAADTVYLAHNGNASTNWIQICSQYGDFCRQVSGATVASFFSVVLFMGLISMSAIALRQR